jgi:beta-lactamase regulating signal transducer with metallopeptidase domain
VIPMTLISSAGASALAEGGVAFVGGALLKGTALLLGSAVAALLLRRASAAARHLVWTVGVVGVLVLPPIGALLPAWRVSVPFPALPSLPVKEASPVKYAFTPETPDDARVIQQLSMTSVTPTASSAAVVSASQPQPDFSFSASTVPTRVNRTLIIALIWFAGMLLSLGSLAASWLRVRGIQASAQPMRAGPFVDAVARASERLQLARPPRVCVGDEQMMPMVWGLFRPVLMLPASAALWPRARLEAVILHEIAHVRRKDALTQFLAEIARAIYWFNPLVWVAARRLYLEREHACDDIVLNTGTRASEYAGELLDLVRSLRTTRATALAAIAMARPSQLKVRVHAVLDDARSRRALTPRFVVAIAVGALVLLLPLAALHPSRADAATLSIPTRNLGFGRAQTAVQSAARTAVQSAARLVTGAARATSPAAPATAPMTAPAPKLAPLAAASDVAVSSVVSVIDQQENCWSNTRRNSVSHNSNDEPRVQSITWSSDRCSGSARIEGTVRMSDDLTGIASISSGGLFRIEEDDGNHERRLTVRPGNGQLEYQYRVDGREAEFDAGGRAWLAQALTALYRNTGFAAAERVDHLLRTQGAQGVINEVGLLRSDYVQSVYLRKLLERSELTPGQVKQAMELAAREIESDYELAQTLIAYATRHDLTDETRTLFINASTTIQSDYERRRVLSAALAKGTLRSSDVSALLASAASIRSDYEKSQLLIGLTSKYKLEPAMRTAYLSAARNISSDYEKGRVLKNLLSQGALSPTELAAMLESTTDIRSDYERAQVLSKLKDYDLSSPSLQEAYLKAAGAISSDYEHRQVLSALLEKERLTPANIDLVLRSAVNIDSDYELSQVLQLVLKNHSLSADQKELFMKALNTIQSEYEYGKVAATLLRQSR